MMTSGTDHPNGGDPEEENAAADEVEEESKVDESERGTLEEVEHTHPHTDETFDRTGVHGRGKRSESDDEDVEEE